MQATRRKNLLILLDKATRRGDLPIVKSNTPRNKVTCMIHTTKAFIRKSNTPQLIIQSNSPRNSVFAKATRR